MTADQPTPANDQNANPGMPIEIVTQYVKDISFEMQGAKTLLNLNEQPEIGLNVEVKANPMEEENSFEVELVITADATSNKEKIFILELTYAGLFVLNGVEKEMVPPVLLIECPRLLFPFARAIVANITREGGFPPLAISPLDFAEIYRRQVEQMQEK